MIHKLKIVFLSKCFECNKFPSVPANLINSSTNWDLVTCEDCLQLKPDVAEGN